MRVGKKSDLYFGVSWLSQSHVSVVEGVFEGKWQGCSMEDIYFVYCTSKLRGHALCKAMDTLQCSGFLFLFFT